MRFLIYNILFFVLMALPHSSFAANKAGKQWDDEIAKVQSYLQELGTARARFVQTNHDGGQLVGTFYLDRPGYLRFEYDPPLEDFIVADGFLIYFYDAELGEATNSPIGLTLADFLLQDEIDLSDDLDVVEAKRAGGLLQVKLVQEGDDGAGSLTLAFDEKPMTLKKWRVVDSQGLITEIELFYLKTGIKHPKGLFTYVKPKSDKPRYNE